MPITSPWATLKMAGRSWDRIRGWKATWAGVALAESTPAPR
jgi:hypothetical protein